MSQIKISQTAQKLLRCPICHSELTQTDARFECVSSGCACHFPIVDGVPVLISEKSSVFSIDDFTSHRQTFFKSTSKNQLASRILSPTASEAMRGMRVRRGFHLLTIRQAKLLADSLYG